MRRNTGLGETPEEALAVSEIVGPEPTLRDKVDELHAALTSKPQNAAKAPKPVSG
jgi:hypothetical protein